jgi:hypothetical protein
MILYHFTALEYLEPILAEGLTKGDVPMSQTEGRNAVWFTTDPNPEGHGLSDGRPMTEAERSAYSRAFGVMPPPGARFPDKRRVRIQVVIPSTDRALKAWIPWARKRLDPQWMATLTRLGGGQAKAKTWFICERAIQLSEFRSVEVRGEDGAFYPSKENAA